MYPSLWTSRLAAVHDDIENTSTMLRSDRYDVGSGVETRDTPNLVKYCVPLIGGSMSPSFQDTASPNLVCRYYMTQKITPAIGCYGNYCNHGSKTSY